MYPRLPTGYITKSTVVVVGGGLLGYAATEVLWGSETFYKTVMPLVHKYVDEETAHNLAVKAASMRLIPRFGPNRWEYPELQCEFLGMNLENPIGLAAGFDKNGEAIRSLTEISGFGLVEVGSVTPIPQDGNAKPRIFRLIEDEGIINRCGFNSEGAAKVSKRVKTAKTKRNGGRAVIGVNLGKNKSSENAKVDYEIGINNFASSCDYLVINVSSPNTAGLRSLQKQKDLQDLRSSTSVLGSSRIGTSADRDGRARRAAFIDFLDADRGAPYTCGVQNSSVLACRALNSLLTHVKFELDTMKLEHPPKVFLKIAPDLTDAEKRDIAQAPKYGKIVVMDRKNGVDALIVTNTTISRPDHLKSRYKSEEGGLSGAPLRQLSTACIKEMYTLTQGRIPIVGCGGVSSGEDAYEKIRAGASVVQLYSAIVFQGFPVIGKVKRELVALLKRDGFKNVADAVGADHREKA